MIIFTQLHSSLAIWTLSVYVCSLEALQSELVRRCDYLLSANYNDTIDDQCGVKRYQVENVADCLDQMALLEPYRNRQLHFAFIGDSRIRQQFYGFLEVTIYNAKFPFRNHFSIFKPTESS